MNIFGQVCHHIFFIMTSLTMHKGHFLNFLFTTSILFLKEGTALLFRWTGKRAFISPLDLLPHTIEERIQRFLKSSWGFLIFKYLSLFPGTNSNIFHKLPHLGFWFWITNEIILFVKMPWIDTACSLCILVCSWAFLMCPNVF